MRRLSLPNKLLIAVLPLIVALGGLLTLTIREGMRDVEQARLGAQLGATWEPLVTTMRAIETERAASSSGDAAAVTQARRDTNQLMVDMDTALRQLGDSRPLLVQLGQALQSLSAARGAADNPAVGVARGLSADDSFNATKADLVAVGRLLPTEAVDTDLARTLTAVAALAEVEQGSIVVLNAMDTVRAGGATTVGVDRLLVQIDRTENSVDLFRATADDRWTTEFRNSGYARALGDSRRAVQQLLTARTAGDETATLTATDVERLAGPVDRIAELRDELATDVVAASDAAAGDIARQTWFRVIVTAVAVVLALLLAFFIVRSITRRVRTVSGAAQEVSTERLPVLVDALRDPRGRTELPEVVEIDARGSDELAELARSFNVLQATLGDVAQEQIEVLRRGVSDIFVTMARRNRSLVDRQLALLDELEANVEDPNVLSDYYRLDHLATRMRRNSESLLVLANTDAMRRRNKPASIDDVVRAAIGEVEDYTRVDIMNLEHLNVRGTVVADVAHLLAELLDNATAFSPPTSRVQITGDLIDGEYRILILDDGMGIGTERLAELNDLLDHPPVVGLSVEPTLGMSVVSLLAAKHGVKVQLAAGGTGTIVKVVLPPATFERRVDGRSPDAEVPPAQLSLRDSPITPSTSSAMLEAPKVTTEPVPAVRPAAVPAAAEVNPSNRARRRAEKADAKAKAKAKAAAEKHAKRQLRSQGKATAKKKKSTPTATPTPTPTRVEAASSNGQHPPTAVIGDPLSIRLPDRIVAAPPEIRIHDEVPSDLSSLVDLPTGTDELPTRLPQREVPPDGDSPSGSRDAAIGELDVDLANLDVTPSWVRDADTTAAPEPARPESVVAPEPETVAPPPPTVPTAPAATPPPPTGPMLPPPTGGPAVPAPAGPGTNPPPPPLPTRGADGLPLRTRSGSSSALMETDRLGETSTTAVGAPSALKAALSAFESGRQVAQDRPQEDDES